MPKTAKRHFDEDLSRAQSLASLARTLPKGTSGEQLIRDDVFRSAWMMGVGAMDAYFCDAYVSLLSSTLMAKSLQSSMTLPEWIKKTKIPIGDFLQTYKKKPNWRWRMSARGLMERDNVLALPKVEVLFNPFFRDGKKIFGDVITSWLNIPSATSRLFGTTKTSYNAITGNKNKDTARKSARKHLNKRMGQVIQRRHDCIHNCDRPKVSPQVIGGDGTVDNVLRDIRFIVENCNTHIDIEFREFLTTSGCSSITRNAVGY